MSINISISRMASGIKSLANSLRVNRLTAVTLATFACQGAWSQIMVEPANWWVGMKNPEVQIMLHDKDIAGLTPSVDSKGVSIKDVTRTDNPNYLFVTLSIGSRAKAGNVTITLSGDGRETTIEYPLLTRKNGSSLRTGFSSDDAIYLVMPDRFANADPTNDTVEGMKEKCDRNEPYGRHGGDIQGVINHLDYIQDLGMTALWMTPFMTNDMPQSSYHGYAITNYYEVDPRLGTLDDIKTLSAELHKRRMKHIMDQVLNHCGTNYWWMSDLPAKDWINKWYDKDGNEIFVRSNYRLSILRDPHASRSDFDLAQKGWFDVTMADMNLANPLVKNYLIQNSIWWIETADLDGIRQDTYPYSDIKSMAEWCDRLMDEYPYLNIVGECWISDAAKLASWQKGYGRANGMEDSDLPTIMDFPLQEAICHALTEDEGWDNGANRLYGSFANDVVYPDPMNIMIFGENHDVGRLLTQLKNDTSALRLAYALLATARGIPQLYYGTEVLMAGNGFDGHANIRHDFPGGWAGDQIDLFADHTSGAEGEMYAYTSRLFKFRQKSMALRRGTMTHYTPEGNVYTFFRYDATTRSRVMVILNLATEERDLSLDRFSELTDGTVTGTDIVSGKEVNAKGSLRVEPRTAIVIGLK